MKKRINQDDVRNIKKAIDEARKLVSTTSFNSSFALILPNISSTSVQNGIVKSEPLTRLLTEYQLTKEFFCPETSDGILESLVQILILDYYYRQDLPNTSTIASISNYYENHEKLDKTFLHNNSYSLFVAYLENFGHETWNKLSFTNEGDWSSIFLLGDSLPFCQVSLDALFHYFKVSCERNPGDIGIRTLSNNILLRLRTDGSLLNELGLRLADVMEDPTLREALPLFLTALVCNDSNSFSHYVDKLTLSYAPKYPLDTYFALGIACPEHEEASITFKASIDRALTNSILTRSQYLQVSSTKSLKSKDIIELVESISNNLNNKDELTQSILFIIEHVNDHEESWFQRICTNLIVCTEKQHEQLLVGLIDLLKDKNLPFVYALFSHRFDCLDRAGVLAEAWAEIIELDPKLFSRNLTFWLKDGSERTLWAILSICGIREIPIEYFVLSADDLENISTSERLYIAYKIAGYIYSKDHLQHLLFSIVETVGADETPLLEGLFDLFNDYLIYNYRSTLSQIDRLLQIGKLPPHIMQLYRSLREQYSNYFADLSRVQEFQELLPDSRLSTYLQFYQQEMFSAKFSKIEKTGIRALFKETPVHSHRWASRRSEQVVHEIIPLARIQSSVEFPSGEKLNPVLQETLRRTYQQITKDEINIG